jgi:SAM-dependent methyltransferase
MHGCDRSPVALEHARRAAKRAGVEARFFEVDALASPLPEGYDLVCSSLFLHHLDGQQAVALLAAMARAADALFVQDLRRTRLGWALAGVTLHALSRSDVARVDGLRSVAGAFSMEEADALAVQAGLAGAVVRRCWPQRWALSWRRR